MREIFLRLCYLLLDSRVFRFLGVGGVSTLIHLCVFVGLMEYVGVWYWYANVVAYVPAIAFNFWFQKHWTFQNKSRDEMHRQVRWFLLKTTLLVGLDVGLMRLLVDYAHVWPLAAKIIVLVPVSYLSYVATRWIFRH